MGSVKSLIMQTLNKLLQLGNWDLDCLVGETFQALANPDLKSWCDLLLYFLPLRQFEPGRKVFCLIDGVEFLAQEESMRSDVELVLNRLRCIVDDKTLPPRFKLLLTTPRNYVDLRKTFCSKDVVILSEDDKLDISLSDKYEIDISTPLGQQGHFRGQGSNLEGPWRTRR
jgi:hypothetical protein